MNEQPQEHDTLYMCWFEESLRHSYPLTSDETTIGRRSDCDIVIDKQHISRLHARIVRDGEKYTIFDLNSRFGTFVRGVRIVEHLLVPGDRVEFGKDHLQMVFTQNPEAFTCDDNDSLNFSILSLRLHNDSASELEKVSWILDFQRHWETTFTPESAFDHILRSALKLSGAERAYILVRSGSGFGYAQGMDSTFCKLEEGEFQTSRSAVARVAKTGLPIFMNDGLEKALAEQQSVILTGANSLACLPLHGIPEDSSAATILGILYLDSTRSMRELSGLNEKILRKLAGDAGNVLERIEFAKVAQQRKTLERELALAEEMQKALLPSVIPVVVGWKLAAYSKPTRYVGGDFYDFMRSPKNGLVGVLGDVAGKGVSAALLSSMILGSLNSLIQTNRSISSAVTSINRLMCEKSITSRYVTLFAAQFNADGTGRFISAGHTTGYLFRAATGTVEELRSNCLIVGAFASARFKSGRIRMGPGDLLISYSDGLTDAENPSGEVFGEERVLELLKSAGASGADAVIGKLTGELDLYTKGQPQTDDITILVIARR